MQHCTIPIAEFAHAPMFCDHRAVGYVLCDECPERHLICWRHAVRLWRMKLRRFTWQKFAWDHPHLLGWGLLISLILLMWLSDALGTLLAT